ncbi:hypothetical protein ACFOJE_20575 [Azotobacter bryophylli]|jgi:hypothetical protein|uniref:Uncharacterized protein n=1 Tax=Azotobacter bryophylli TaxID=1986537 RepID=A0ABV7B1F6_9GAMM
MDDIISVLGNLAALPDIPDNIPLGNSHDAVSVVIDMPDLPLLEPLGLPPEITIG